MKKIFIVFISMIIAINLFPNKNDTANFENGISLYSKNEFEKALKIFTDLKNKGYDNFEINYNIGSCYYKLDKLGFSRFYFERALFFRPYDKNLMGNLKLIYSKVLKDSVIGEQEIMNKRIIFFIPLKILIILLIVFLISAIIFIFIFFKILNLRMVSLIFIIVSIFFVITISIIFMIQYSDFNKKIYIVTSNSANIFLLPKDTETILTTITEGSKDEVIIDSNDYAKVKLSDGSNGWIKKSDIIEN